MLRFYFLCSVQVVCSFYKCTVATSPGYKCGSHLDIFYFLYFIEMGLQKAPQHCSGAFPSAYQHTWKQTAILAAMSSHEVFFIFLLHGVGYLCMFRLGFHTVAFSARQYVFYVDNQCMCARSGRISNVHISWIVVLGTWLLGYFTLKI